jgi:drug/metabolite transporter (DMT)-like permease
MKNIKGKMYLLLAFSLAGTSVITGYILSEKLGSFTITAVSLGVMLLCLSPFYGAKTIQTMRLLKHNDWKMLVLQAVFGIFLFRIFLLFGVGLTSTIEAGILTGTTPAITSVLAFFVLKERFSGWAAIGIACTVSGIVLLQGVNLYAAAFSMQHIGGNALVLCAAASEAAFNIISRRHRTKQQYDTHVKIHPMVQTLLVSAIAFGLSMIPALAEQPFSALQMAGTKEWLALLWYGLIVTALAFVFFYEGVKRCDAYTTAAFSGMIPLASMLLSLFLLHEPIGYAQWTGGFLIITSMLLIGKSHSPKRLTARPAPPVREQTVGK